MEDIHPRGGGARGRSVLECGRSKELRKKKACCFLNQTTKDEEKLWAVEKWKSKSRIPTFPPPRMPAAQGKKRRLHKTLDAPPLPYCRGSICLAIRSYFAGRALSF